MGQVKFSLIKLRQAVADYMMSEGCDCCELTDAHDEAAIRLAKMLRVRKYADGSGYDFRRYKTDKKKK